MDKRKINFARREPSIPEEIIFEIFSWLPVKLLMRFKLVSRFCNSLVSETDFVNIHTCRSITRPGGTKFFLNETKAVYTAEQEEDGNISASLFQTERFDGLYSRSDSLLNCVNGLFCVWNSLSARPAAIFNRSTREIRFLPDPNITSSWCYYSLGFEPEEKKCKVFLSASPGGYRKQWVLTLGIDKSWRETQSISPFVPYCKPSVCISGVIYQFVRHPKRGIAAFDVKSENFEIIALWNTFHWVYYCELIEVKGKLAIIDYRKRETGYLNLWILEQTPERKWQKNIIRIPLVWNNIESGPISSCTSRDGKIVFIVNLKSGVLCWCYDVITKIWRELVIKRLPEETYIKGIYSYVERLVM